MREHTAGSWEISGVVAGSDGLPGGFMISAKQPLDQQFRAVAAVWNRSANVQAEPDAETFANARLIVAAPDLLEACWLAVCALKDHVQYDDGESAEREAYDAAVAAIAKAEREA